MHLVKNDVSEITEKALNIIVTIDKHRLKRLGGYLKYPRRIFKKLSLL